MNKDIYIQTKPSVLVVDDSEYIRNYADKLLKEAGYTVMFAPDGSTCLDFVKKHEPDVILLDTDMPEMSGFEVLETLHTQKRVYSIILLAQSSDIAYRIAAFDKGADGCISKPINNRELIARINAAARLTKQKKELIGNEYFVKHSFRKYRETSDTITEEQKIAEIAKLLSGLAHHINSPMGFIKSNMATLVRYADILAEGAKRLISLSEISHSGNTFKDKDIMEVVQWLKESKVNYIYEDIKPLISESMEGIDRISSVLQRLLIIDQVVRYANFVLIDLNKLIKSIDYSSEYSPPRGVSFKTDLCSYPLMLYGKVEQLRIAIENVLKNAIDAVGEQGEIKIFTDLDDGCALIEIHDTGEGILPGVISRVFEPFFSTKESINRVGMELTITQYIIQAHGGMMKIRSDEGSGTCVSIRVPLHDLK